MLFGNDPVKAAVSVNLCGYGSVFDLFAFHKLRTDMPRVEYELRFYPSNRENVTDK